MAIHTRGYVAPSITEENVKNVIAQIYATDVKATEYMPASFRLEFKVEDEDRILHVHVNLDEEFDKMQGNATVLSFIHWGSAVTIMTDILQHFGGYLVEKDTVNEWVYVERLS